MSTDLTQSTPSAKRVLPERFMLVEIDAVFDGTVESPPEERDVLDLARYSLGKLFRLGWRIHFWSSESRTHYDRLVQRLADKELLLFADPLSDDQILLRYHPPEEIPINTKLTLMENQFGKILDEVSPHKLVMIESSEEVATYLQLYVKKRAAVHLAPIVWFEVAAMSQDQLTQYLTRTY